MTCPHSRGCPATRVRPQPSSAGFTLIELLIAVAIISILAAIAYGMYQDAKRKANYARAGVDTKTAMEAAIRYGSDFNAYPRSLAVLRTNGYMNVPNRDPWGNTYRLSSALTSGAVPNPQQDAWVCSQGPRGGGTCPGSNAAANSVRGFPRTGISGSVGYSSLYGGWTGW